MIWACVDIQNTYSLAFYLLYNSSFRWFGWNEIADSGKSVNVYNYNGKDHDSNKDKCISDMKNNINRDATNINVTTDTISSFSSSSSYDNDNGNLHNITDNVDTDAGDTNNNNSTSTLDDNHSDFFHSSTGTWLG